MSRRHHAKPVDPAWLVELRTDAAELVDRCETKRWVSPDRHNTRNADNPKLAAQRAKGFHWTTDAPGLLVQLHALRGGITGAAGGEHVDGSTPHSKLPTGADTADLLVEIESNLLALHWKAMRQLGRQEELSRRDKTGAVAYLSPRPAAALRQLLDLVDDVDDKLRKRIYKDVHRHVLAARIALSYSAPMVTLRNRCPCCDEQSLIVRSDASSDVICSNEDCVDDNGNHMRWPRLQWPALLAGRLS